MFHVEHFEVFLFFATRCRGDGCGEVSHSAECDLLSVCAESRQRHTLAEGLRFFVIPFAYAHFNKKSLYTFPQEAVKIISLGVISLMRFNQSHRFFLLVGKTD